MTKYGGRERRIPTRRGERKGPRRKRRRRRKRKNSHSSVLSFFHFAFLLSGWLLWLIFCYSVVRRPRRQSVNSSLVTFSLSLSVTLFSSHWRRNDGGGKLADEWRKEWEQNAEQREKIFSLFSSRDKRRFPNDKLKFVSSSFSSPSVIILATDQLMKDNGMKEQISHLLVFLFVDVDLIF